MNSAIKKAFLKLIYGRKINFGAKTHFRKRFSVMIDGGEITIGKGVFFNNDCSLNSMGKISIGDNTIIGENVRIYDHNHNFNKGGLVKDQGFSVGTVKIGKNVWICSNAIILKGAVVGDNCVIGAGCIISERIPENSIVRRDQQQVTKKILQKESKGDVR
jgi:acetyltransferase-like isoleucine patch superfamily enzyme